MNLVDHTARNSGRIPVFDVTEPSQALGKPHDVAFSTLNAGLMDVAFVDKAIQCDPDICVEVEKDYKFAGRKNWDETNQSVWVFDVFFVSARALPGKRAREAK